MRCIQGDEIITKLKNLFLEISFEPESLKNISFAHESMDSKERNLAEIIDENMVIAKNEKRSLCQDSGLAQVFIEKGKMCNFSAAYSIDAIVEQAVREAFDEGNLRKSIVSHPFERVNTKDNTPSFVHIKEVDGAGLTMYAIVKGGGSENVSSLKMLEPSKGREGVADFVIETIKKAGGKGCPPYFVGVGVGSTFDSVGILAKEALIKKELNDQKLYDLIDNKLSSIPFGVLGFPGKFPVKSVYIKTAPTHIAMLPVAVSLSCHSYRVGKISF